MNPIASLFGIALFAAGCAHHGAVPPTDASAQRSVISASADRSAPRPAAEGVELRHFYLLSPGPKATLVVTRSDLAGPSQ